MVVPNLGIHIVISFFLSALYLVTGEYLIGMMAASFTARDRDWETIIDVKK